MLLKSVKYIFRKSKSLIRRIKRKIIYTLELSRSRKERIISFEQYGELVLLWKEKSFEKIFLPKVYHLTEESWINFYYPRIEARKFTDALVYGGSDFVVTKDGAIWEKYFKPQWTKIIPADQALLKIEDEYIFY